MLSYPVGAYITANKPRIIKMAEAFCDIEEFKDKEINLICRGSSGAIIATIFSIILPNVTNIIHIKKEGESAHDNGLYMNGEKVNVIVDDIIATGATLNAIYNKVSNRLENKPIDCVCITGCYDRSIKFEPKYVICSR
jgi:orotate phosphoribosyltransferase-like protein